MLNCPTFMNCHGTLTTEVTPAEPSRASVFTVRLLYCNAGRRWDRGRDAKGENHIYAGRPDGVQYMVPVRASVVQHSCQRPSYGVTSAAKGGEAHEQHEGCCWWDSVGAPVFCMRELGRASNNVNNG